MPQLFRVHALIVFALLGLMSLSGCSIIRTFFPSSAHEIEPPSLPDLLARPAILVFSKTNGFRHDEAIEAGLPALRSIASKRRWGYVETENGAVHNPEQLARFDVIVWFQVSGDVLDDDQRLALQDWIKSGGSFLGVHGTGGDPSYDWNWQPETLVGAQFVGHPMGPQFQEATMKIEARGHPVMRHLDETWTHTEEWYSFEKSPRGPNTFVLATVDESTYSPLMKILFWSRDLAMGEDHPVIWTHCIGRGHSIYSALGHRAEAYSDAKHLGFLEESIAWLTRARYRDCANPR